MHGLLCPNLALCGVTTVCRGLPVWGHATRHKQCELLGALLLGARLRRLAKIAMNKADSNSSDDDVPLSQYASATATAAAGSSSHPAPPVKVAAKRKRQKEEPPKSKAVSARAARTGGGGWDLSEAAGDLDAEYETLGVLGRGNFAEINLVRHRSTNELRALKFCCKLDAPSYTHLRAEVQLASRVRGHPFVLSPLAVSDSAGRAGNYSVLLPLCPGGDLLQLLRQQPHHALPEASARSYAAMVALGLTAMHEQASPTRQPTLGHCLPAACAHTTISSANLSRDWRTGTSNLRTC